MHEEKPNLAAAMPARGLAGDGGADMLSSLSGLDCLPERRLPDGAMYMSSPVQSWPAAVHTYIVHTHIVLSTVGIAFNDQDVTILTTPANTSLLDV